MGPRRGSQAPVYPGRGPLYPRPAEGERLSPWWQEGRGGGGRPQTPWGEALRFGQYANTDVARFFSCFYVGKNSYPRAGPEHG